MHAPHKHNQRIRAVVAAAGAVALITGTIVVGLAGEEAAAEPDAAQNQQIEAPGGAFTPESREIAARAGMANLGWNVDPGDFNRPGADEISAVQDQLKTKGPTILIHDGGGDRSRSVEALEKLLP